MFEILAATQLAERDSRVRGVVAVAAFLTLRGAVTDYARRYLPAPNLVPEGWLQGGVDWAGELAGFEPDAASPLRAVSRLGGRLLLLHGDGDTQIGVRHSAALAEAAGHGVRFIAARGDDHASITWDPIVQREGVTWLRRRLAAP